MPQRSVTGSRYCSARAPIGKVAIAASETGATSRQLQRRVSPTVKGMLAIEVDDQECDRRDPRLVDRRHQRHIDQRRAEAGKAAHHPRYTGDRDRRGKTRIGDDVRQQRSEGKFCHGKSSGRGAPFSREGRQRRAPGGAGHPCGAGRAISGTS